MKTINPEPRLSLSKTRSDFLTIMPMLRKYILEQSVEFPQENVDHTLRRLMDECPVFSNADEECVRIAGCIDTEKRPFKTFWLLFDGTLEGYATLMATQASQPVTAEYTTIGTVAILSSALRTYLTGIKIYHAAKYAYSKPIKQDRLGAYWERVKI